MDIQYDKSALRDYMDQVNIIVEMMRRKKDNCNSKYNDCMQQYCRMHTSFEEIMRRAYNDVESAETSIRRANIEYESAKRSVENSEDETETEIAYNKLQSALRNRNIADEEYQRAASKYSEAAGRMKYLEELWASRYPYITAKTNIVDDSMSSFLNLVSNGNNDMCTYIDSMDKVNMSLYESSALPLTVDAEVEESVFREKTSQSTKKITQDSEESNSIRSGKILFKSKKGNDICISNPNESERNIKLTIGNDVHNFPFSSWGISKAYRTALKSGDDELISFTDMLSMSDYNNEKENPTYVRETISSLNEGLSETFDKELVFAGSQARKMNLPTGKSSLGSWDKNVFYLNDEYVPVQFNDEGYTIRQIKGILSEKYGISLGGIRYVNGVADFSSISVANVSTDDIVMFATGLSQDEYDGLSQIDRAEVLKNVFSKGKNGKDKRTKNFLYADKIAAEKRFPIPGLPLGYSYDQLKKWRKDNKFSWDEQVHGGYYLVPSVIHGCVRHTGLVGTSGKAFDYLKEQEWDLKNHPENFALKDADAPISISELLKIK